MELVVLVADKNMRFAVEGFLENRRLPAREISAHVLIHPKRDPGTFRQCHEFLRSRQRIAAHALVVFDRHGCGSEKSRVDLEGEVEVRMAQNGWEGRSAAVVIDPELEAWVWAGYSQIEQALGWSCGHEGLEDWLIRTGYLHEAGSKPQRPKEALESVLYLLKKRRTAALYSELAKAMDFKRCTDPAFAKLRTVLAAWFPRQAD